MPGPDTALAGLIPSRVVRGFVFAILAGVFFQCLNVCVKALAADMPPLLVAWGRWLVGVFVVAPFLLRARGLAGLKTQDLKLHGLRAIFHSTGYGIWYSAVIYIPLATTAALGFTGPIFVTLGAALILGEKVTRTRWIAVLIGFLGMLVILRPGIAEVGFGVWLMLASVPLIAGSNLVAKVVAGRDSPGVVVFWQSVLGAICFTPVGLWFWQMPTPPQMLLFLGAGVFGTLGYFFITWSYRLLDISAVQSVTFLGIIWASLFDMAVFGRTAEIWTFVGAAIIVAATTYIARREANRTAAGGGR